MHTRQLIPFAAAASILLAACSSTPGPNANLEQARSEFATLRSTPNANTMAALEIKDAELALGRAEEAVSQKMKPEVIDHRAYIAKQRVGIAKETLNLKVAEAEQKQIASQRTQAQLDIRTQQARSANIRAQQMESELKELAAKQTNRGTVVTLGDVLFDTGKSDLKTGGLRNVQRLADYLRNNPERKVMIEGFTDSVGSEEFNLQLSERRANSVRNALLDMGVSSDRIMTRGYGEDYPVAGNDTAASRQMNRRVEVIISDEQGSIKPR